MPVSSAIASVATVSVGERIAPSTKPTSSGKPMTQWATKATLTDVSTTSPVASCTIGLMKRLNWRKSVTNASPKISGGKNTRKTRSGASLMTGTPGTNASAMPPSKNTIGYG